MELWGGCVPPAPSPPAVAFLSPRGDVPSFVLGQFRARVGVNPSGAGAVGAPGPVGLRDGVFWVFLPQNAPKQPPRPPGCGSGTCGGLRAGRSHGRILQPCLFLSPGRVSRPRRALPAQPGRSRSEVSPPPAARHPPPPRGWRCFEASPSRPEPQLRAPAPNPLLVPGPACVRPPATARTPGARAQRPPEAPSGRAGAGAPGPGALLPLGFAWQRLGEQSAGGSGPGRFRFPVTAAGPGLSHGVTHGPRTPAPAHRPQTHQGLSLRPHRRGPGLGSASGLIHREAEVGGRRWAGSPGLRLGSAVFSPAGGWPCRGKRALFVPGVQGQACARVPGRGVCVCVCTRVREGRELRNTPGAAPRVGFLRNQEGREEERPRQVGQDFPAEAVPQRGAAVSPLPQGSR